MTQKISAPADWYLIATASARALALQHPERVTLTMATLARNSPVALAIATTVFPDRPLIAIATTVFPDRPLIALALVVGPLIELPVLALTANRLQPRPHSQAASLSQFSRR